MKLKFTYLLLLIFLSVSSGFGQQPAWLKKIKEIELLRSTEQDVVRIFGEPEKSDYPYFRIFNLKEGKLDVQYSMGYCTELKRKGWNVPEFTVTGISLSPKKQVEPEKLGINLSNFELTEVFDVPGAFEGRNDELGIELVKTRKGKIESISFYPPSKFDHLYCRE
jgi:hypothetical protein